MKKSIIHPAETAECGIQGIYFGIEHRPSFLDVRGSSPWYMRDVRNFASIQNNLSSKFHMIVLWLGSVKFHCYALPNVMFWRKLEVGATKDECLSALRI